MAQTGDNPIAGQLHAMKQRMEALYSRSFTDSSTGPADHSEMAGGQGFFQPPVDVWETAKEWLILVDLPGVGQEDFHVELIEDRLVIRGHRKTAPVLDGTAAAPLERPDGTFSRTFVLPADTRAEAIKAELKHGVLTVAITKNHGLPVASQQVQVRPG